MPSVVVARIGELDLPDRLYPALPRWLTQVGVALLCVGAGGLLRVAINIVAPGSAVFVLLFPVIMIATLFARWQAGLLTGGHLDRLFLLLRLFAQADRSGRAVDDVVLDIDGGADHDRTGGNVPARGPASL